MTYIESNNYYRGSYERPHQLRAGRPLPFYYFKLSNFEGLIYVKILGYGNLIYDSRELGGMWSSVQKVNKNEPHHSKEIEKQIAHFRNNIIPDLQTKRNQWTEEQIAKTRLLP